MGGWGFCDLYNDDTGEVWELKKNSFSLTCQKAYAQNQLKGYIDGRLKHNKSLDLKLPDATRIKSDSFPFNDGTDDYRVWYWYEGDGILRYDYVKITHKFEYNCLVCGIAIVAAVAVTPGLAPFTIPLLK